MFEDEEAEAEREAMAVGASEFLDSLDHTHRAQKYIFICVLIDLIIFGAIFFFPRLVFNLSIEIHFLIALTLFTSGFIVGNGIWRLAFPGSQEQEHINPGIMSGYKYSSQQNKRWLIWLVSAATGTANLLAALLLSKLI